MPGTTALRPEGRHLDFFLKTRKQDGTQHWVRTDAFPCEIVWETREDREAWEKRQERSEPS